MSRTQRRFERLQGSAAQNIEAKSEKSDLERADDRLSFVIRLPRHPLALVPPADSPQVTPRVGMLLARIEGEMIQQAIQDALGLADREHFHQTYLAPALKQGIIEMTLPDKPNSRSQRYCQTPPWQRWLDTQPGGSAS